MTFFLGMTFSAVGYKFNVNESKMYTIYDVFKQNT